MLVRIKVLHNSPVRDFYGSSAKKQYLDDAALDVYCPHTFTVPAQARSLIYGLNIAVETVPSMPLLMLARSSTGKSPIRLSNSVGLIDRNYRGEIMAIIDNVSDEPYEIRQGTRLFQLLPFSWGQIDGVNLVQNLSDTERGGRGWGSTGS